MEQGGGREKGERERERSEVRSVRIPTKESRCTPREEKAAPLRRNASRQGIRAVDPLLDRFCPSQWRGAGHERASPLILLISEERPSCTSHSRITLR